MKRISIFVVIALTLLPAIKAAATALPDFPFLVSTGEASRQVKPDIADLHIRFLAFDEDAEIAVQQLSEAFNSVLQALSEYEVPIESVEATDLRRSVTRARNSDYQDLEILGYQVSRTITVHLDSLALYSEMVEALAVVPGLSTFETDFDASSRTQIEEELLAEASANAIRKAELMAEGFGQEVDSVYAISQASNFGSFFATFGAADYGIYAESLSDVGVPVTRMAMFIPETITIAQRINAVLRMAQR